MKRLDGAGTAGRHAPASRAGMPHRHDLSRWQHSHVFDSGNRDGEASTRWVLALTLATMVAEIGAGWWSGSMALLADGWHMGTHALALAVAAGAYALARRHRDDPRYAFGTWKIEVLGSFASALVLMVVAIGIGFESMQHWWRGDPIDARTALAVAVIGLVVNLLSAWLLHRADGHDESHAATHGHHGHRHGRHGHGHGHAHGHAHTPAAAPHDHHGHAHRHAAERNASHSHAETELPAGAGEPPLPQTGVDLNLRAAYVHVLTDAFTSVLAIAALAGAVWLGWWWLDPVVGIVGAVVIAIWAAGLLRQSAAVLLDREMDHPLASTIRRSIEADGDAQVADLHLWRVGRGQFAAVATVVADSPLSPSTYRARLAGQAELVHLSVEVNRCPDAVPRA